MNGKEGKAPVFKGFYGILEEDIRGYDGSFKEIIKHTPAIFKLFTNLLEDPMVQRESKPTINATIAYFVAPFDALPEEVYGPVGYLDDLFLATWSIKKLEEELGYPVLENNWEGEGELATVIDATYEKTKEIIGEMEADILEYVGLL